MIYTLTCNPSLDYYVTVNGFETGRVNRACAEDFFPGGKGINVSMVLKNLGLSSRALGFRGGFTGEEIERRLKAAGCDTDFIRLEGGSSRMNLKLLLGAETEINGKGPAITGGELQRLYQKLAGLGRGDVLVLAGSLSGDMPDDFYRDIMERLAGRGLKIIVDAAGGLLEKALDYGPFLVKPNQHELGEIFGAEAESKEDILRYGRKLKERGAENVLISMGARGAILLAEDGEAYECGAPAGTAVKTVGSGDSMVAGFLAGYLEQRDCAHALSLGVAAGSASAFAKGLATRQEILGLLRTIEEEGLLCR